MGLVRIIAWMVAGAAVAGAALTAATVWRVQDPASPSTTHPSAAPSAPASPPNASTHTTTNATTRTIPLQPRIIEIRPATDAEAAPAPTLAVVPFRILDARSPQQQQLQPPDDRAVSQDLADICASLLITRIDSDRYILFDRLRLEAILQEMKLAASDLVDQDAAAGRFGRLRGVRLMVLGSLSRLGDQWHLNARIVDSQTGRVHQRAWVRLHSLDELDHGVTQLAAQLKLRPDDPLARYAAAAVNLTPPSPRQTHNPNPPTTSDQSPTAPDDNHTPPTPPTPVAPPPRTLDELVNAFNPAETFHVSIRTLDNRKAYRIGQSIRFRIEASRDCVITLIALDANGKASILLPNDWHDRGRPVRLRAGVPIVLPEADAPYHFPIQPPAGQTLIKIIATPNPLNLAAYQQPNTANPPAEPPNPSATSPATSPTTSAANWPPPNAWATAELTIITHIDDADADARRIDQPDQHTAAQYITLPSVHLPPLSDAGDNNALAINADNDITVDNVNVDSRTAADNDADNDSDNRNPIDPTPIDASPRLRILDLAPQGDPNDRLLSAWTQWRARITPAPASALAPPNPSPASSSTAEDHNRSIVDAALDDLQWALANPYTPDLDVNHNPTRNTTRNTNHDAPQPVRIGVIDAAFNVRDPRISFAIARNPGEIPDNQRDDDGNGLVDDVLGYDFLTHTPLGAPGNHTRTAPAAFDHGLFIASIIVGAQSPTGWRVRGLAPNAQIIPAVAAPDDDQRLLRLAPHNNTAPASPPRMQPLVDALQHVAQRGARVINLSVGQRVSTDQLNALNKLPIWDQLEQQGVIIICAAGNQPLDNDQHPIFPASLPRSNIISVMAVDPAGLPARRLDRDGRWSQFTSYGKTTVDLAAPGALILGAAPRGDVDLRSGSSYAAAHVTAAVALALQRRPDINPASLARLLRETARPIPALRGRCAAQGVLDIDALLQAVEQQPKVKP